MAKQRTRRKDKPGATKPQRRPRMGLAPFLPGLVAAVISFPCIWLGYFWDDYLFLNQGSPSVAKTFILPDPHATFYRPIPQGLYFGLLRLLDPSNGLLGHILNLVAFAAACALLVTLVSRLRSPRAGLYAGLVFACLGAAPGLVAWISCSQDLFAIVFVLAAFILRHGRHDIAALVCATAAVLSKEPAVAAFPILVFWDHIVGRPVGRPWANATVYGVALLLWVSVHPGIRVLLGRGFQSGATGYVGIDGPDRWGSYLWRYGSALVNMPPTGFAKVPMDDRLPYGLMALAIVIAGVWYFDRGLGSDRGTGEVPLKRVAWLGILFGLPTLLMPTLLVRHWAPYFVCIPAVGAALLLGSILAKQRTAIACTSIAIFLLLGLRFRGAHPAEEPAWTESVFVQAAHAVKQVRTNFRVLFPTFPPGSQIVVSTASTGVRGIHSTMVDNQALRSWYRDATLRTVGTLRRPRTESPEYLTRITTDLDVIAIDADAYDIRSTTAYPPDMNEIGRPLRNYARAVAAGGETDRAIRILRNLGRAESPEGNLYTDRLIAMVLIAANRHDEATQIIETSPEFTQDDALALVKRLVAEATESEALDVAAFEAFGLSMADPETVRWMMRDFRKDGLRAQGAWFAERLQRLVPSDAEAAKVLAEASEAGIRADRAPH